MEGSETGGAWVGLGLGREDGGEPGGTWVGTGPGREMEGSETGGAWVGTRLGREDAGERDGSWRGKMEGSETGARKHRKHHCRLLWGSAKVERSMGGVVLLHASRRHVGR